MIDHPSFLVTVSLCFLPFSIPQSTFQLGFNGEHCVATEVGRHDTGTRSVMNCATYQNAKAKKMYFVAGMDGHSQLYFISQKFEIARSLSYSDQNDNEKIQEPTVRNRKPKEENGTNPKPKSESLRQGLLSQRRLRMLAHPMESLQTDMRYMFGFLSLFQYKSIWFHPTARKIHSKRWSVSAVTEN